MVLLRGGDSVNDLSALGVELNENEPGNLLDNPGKVTKIAPFAHDAEDVGPVGIVDNAEIVELFYLTIIAGEALAEFTGNGDGGRDCRRYALGKIDGGEVAEGFF